MNSFWFKLFIVTVIVIIDLIPRQSTSFLEIGSILDEHLNNKFKKHIDNDIHEIEAGMQFKVYTGKSIRTATITDIPITKSEIMLSYMDVTKPLIIYIHGFREVPSDESVQTVIGVHLERGTDNVFLLDWSRFASDNFITVLSRTKNIAQIFASSLDRLIELGLDVSQCHVIGHSLGGQIAGLGGKYSKYSIARVTALDPAGPGFYHSGAEHIDSNSAQFVDIIHTDGGFYGALQSTGTVDIFPNGGVRPQPGCAAIGPILSPIDLCSHWRSWRYYVESVRDTYAFLATECQYYFDYLHQKCKNNRIINMGYGISTDVRGTYYLTTKDKFPFGNNSSYTN